MNTSYKLTTVFTSIKNNLKYLSLPFVCFNLASVIEAFETIFKEEIADGTLSFKCGPVTPEFKQWQTITIKGLINWDGLLVKDVEIFFDGNTVAEVTARLFSFYGENSLKNLLKVYHPNRVRGKGLTQFFPAKHEGDVTELYIQHTNAARCLRQKDNEVAISLFVKNVSKFKFTPFSNDTIPIIMRNCYGIAQYNLSLADINESIFTSNPDGTLSLSAPAFLGNYDYAIKSVTLTPPTSSVRGELIIELDTDDGWMAITENLSKIIPDATWRNGSTILYKDKHNIRVLHDTTKIEITLSN